MLSPPVSFILDSIRHSHVFVDEYRHCYPLLVERVQFTFGRCDMRSLEDGCRGRACAATVDATLATWSIRSPYQ
jgi:hypothetical protein